MTHQQTAGALSLRDIGGILYRRKLQIIVTFLLIAGAAAAITFSLPKRYSARTKILVKNERADMVVSADNHTTTLIPSEVGESEINTEIELLNSNDLLRHVVIACKLDRFETGRKMSSDNSKEVAIEKAVHGLEKDLSIFAVRKANIIEVDYSSDDPKLAVDVLKTLTTNYLEDHLKVHSSPGTYEFFVSQSARYRVDLRDAENRLADFRRQNDIVLLPQQEEDAVRRAAESDALLQATEAAGSEYLKKVGDATNQISIADRRVTTQTHTMSNQYSVEHLSTMIIELQNKRTQLLSKFKPDDRLVQEVDQEMADTQAALLKAKTLTGQDDTTDINPLRQALEIDVARERADLAGIEARRSALAQQSQEQHAKLAKLGHSTLEYEDLLRAQKEAEDNYLMFSRKAEEARITSSLDQQKIANVAIAENPVEPHLPSEPNVPMDLILGVFVAGFSSLGLAFGKEYLLRSKKTFDMEESFRLQSSGRYALETIEAPSELEALTGLRVLAITRRS
jgi:uncharacterized protein involved in exopolysaccharide biosynthesis